MLRSPFAWLVLILLGLEVTAWRLLPMRRVPNAREASRNPLTRDGWPEYTRAEGPRRGKLAVIIGHSQGLGMEIEDAERIYAARLRETLRHERPDDSLENWSTPGLRTVALEVLSLRAAEREADFVLLMLGIANFDRPEQINLAFPQGDVPLIAADASLWERFPGTLFYQNLDAGSAVETLAAAHSQLLRARGDVQSLAGGRLRPDLQRALLGRAVRPARRLDSLAGDRQPLPPPPHAIDRQLTAAERRILRVGPWDLTRALGTLRRLFPTLHGRLREEGVRELWVWAPVGIDLFAPRDRERLRAFHREATRVVEAGGGRALDLSEAIPTERFYTRGHYDEEGHRLMSRVLWPVIRDELR